MCRKTAHLCFRIEAYPEIFVINSRSVCSVFLPLCFLNCYPHKKRQHFCCLRKMVYSYFVMPSRKFGKPFPVIFERLVKVGKVMPHAQS